MDRTNRLTTERLRLMLDEPYLASALARLPFVDATASEWCATMATDGYHIFYDLAFVETLTDDEVRFVIAHELMHCVFGHIDRRGPRQPLAWNMAIDYATNALLVAAGLPMPAIGLFDRAYTGMTAEQIYDRIVSSMPKRRAAHDSSQATDTPAGGHALGIATPWRGRATGPAGTGFDEHLDPEDDRIKTLGPAASDMPSEEERRRLRAVLAKELVSKLPGTVAGRTVAELEAASVRQISWEALLAQFVSGLRRSDYRLFPFNRKHLWRGLYLPTLGAPGPQHLVLAVDTSGSMSDDDLRLIAGELDRLRSVSECRLTVLQFDTRLTHVEVREPYESTPLGRKHAFHGRGGTDIRVPFTWLTEETRAGRIFPPADALIVVTDGFGPMPDDAPDLPLLWIATASAVEKFPYGTTIRLAPPRAS